MGEGNEGGAFMGEGNEGEAFVGEGMREGPSWGGE